MSANGELTRVKEWTWIRGFSNLYRKESQAWWSTRRWWINGLLWMGVAAGLVVAFQFVFPAFLVSSGQAAALADNGGPVGLGLQGFFDLGVLVISAGVIILCQDLFIGEKQSGLTEYLLANPMQRKAYVLAKCCAALVAILVLLIVLPGAAVYSVISLGIGEPFPLQPFLAGLGIVMVHSLFYLTLTIVLGVFCSARAPVLGIPLGILFCGVFLSFLFKPLLSIGPWMLRGFAHAIASSLPVPTGLLWPPLLATAVWCGIFICAALIKFERTEF